MDHRSFVDIQPLLHQQMIFSLLKFFNEIQIQLYQEKMKKNFLIYLVILVILQCSKGQSVTCPDGTFPTASPPDADHGQCTRCHFACKTCTGYIVAVSPPSCTSYKDFIKGYEGSTMKTLCYSKLYAFDFGYNSQADNCLPCIQGCRRCVIDYDVCVECKLGWDYDVKNRKCIRASLGLAATILGLSVLVLVLTITTCICSMKI